MTVEEFFGPNEDARRIYEAIASAIAEIGPAEARVTKSQVAFRRRTGFAFTWMPGMYLPGAAPPLVLTVSLRRRDPSPRWKQVVEPARGRYIHHLELRSPDEIDGEVRAWLLEAWEQAT